MVIDLRSKTQDFSKHIVASINSMAKIKQEQINIEKAMMMDKVERKRGVEDYREKKGIDQEFKGKENQAMMDRFGQPDQLQNQQSQTVQQTVPGPGGGQITGQAEGQTPQAVRDPIWRGVPLRPPGSKGKTLTADDIAYGGIYKKVVSGENLTEGEEKRLMKYNDEGKEFDKFREVISNIDQGGIYNKQYGEVMELDKEQSEAYVQSELGMGWKKKYPEIKEAIDEKFGIDEFGYKKGETKNDFPGKKGTFEYMGNNQWSKIR